MILFLEINTLGQTFALRISICVFGTFSKLLCKITQRRLFRKHTDYHAKRTASTKRQTTKFACKRHAHVHEQLSFSRSSQPAQGAGQTYSLSRLKQNLQKVILHAKIDTFNRPTSLSQFLCMRKIRISLPHGPSRKSSLGVLAPSLKLPQNHQHRSRGRQI